MARFDESKFGSAARRLSARNLDEQLASPAGISKRERREIYKRGRQDARAGVAHVTEYDDFASPYCDELAAKANMAIAAEWSSANAILSELQVQIDAFMQEEGQLREQINKLYAEKDEALAIATRLSYKGDSVVSEHLAGRRQERREKPVRDYYDGQIKAVKARLEQLRQNAAPHRTQMQAAKLEALNRERVLRAHYLWRLSVYVYGASEYMKVTADMVNDAAIDSSPRAEIERLYGIAGMKGVEEPEA